MTHFLTVLATSAGAITGYELAKRWFNRNNLDLAQRRAVRLAKLQRLVRDALPADPALDSPHERDLREAAFGE